MVASFVGLETDHVGTEDALDNVYLGGQDIEEVFFWEGCVQKPSDVDLDVPLLCSLSQEQGKKHQVVVMYPDLITVL